MRKTLWGLSFITSAILLSGCNDTKNILEEAVIVPAPVNTTNDVTEDDG